MAKTVPIHVQSAETSLLLDSLFGLPNGEGSDDAFVSIGIRLIVVCLRLPAGAAAYRRRVQHAYMRSHADGGPDRHRLSLPGPFHAVERCSRQSRIIVE